MNRRKRREQRTKTEANKGSKGCCNQVLCCLCYLLFNSLRFLCYLLFKISWLLPSRGFAFAKAREVVGGRALGLAQGEDLFLCGVPLAGFGSGENRGQSFVLRVGHGAFSALL